MITLKSAREIETMAESGALLADVHKNLRDFIKPGVTSWDIEVFVRNYIESHGGIAAQIGFEGYEYATCISINDEICHGFPRKKPLKNGDLVKVDMCIDLKGGISDSCRATHNSDAEDFLSTCVISNLQSGFLLYHNTTPFSNIHVLPPVSTVPGVSTF